MERVEYRLTNGSHVATVLFGMWLIGGVFIDGFAHNHGVVETFFTPWHAILYSGFLASASWMVWLVYRDRKSRGSAWSTAIPQGYGLGLIGVAVFLIAGLGDMLWHVIFGIEQNIEALLSPTHLLLLTGGVLIVTSPYRAAHRNPDMKAPGWGAFLPPFLSVALSVAAAAFFLMYAWMFRYNLPSQTYVDWYASHYPSAQLAETNQARGLSYILLNTLVLMYPVFLLIKRFKVPFGTVTLMFTVLTVLMNVLDGFQNYPSIIVAAAAGLVTDIVYRWLEPAKSRAWTSRVVALTAPAALWTFYFAGMAAIDGIGWPTELWTGSIVEAGLASLAVSILAFGPERGITE